MVHSRLPCTPLIYLLTAFTCWTAFGHTGSDPSLHDTVASLDIRLRETKTADQLMSLTEADILSFANEDERRILSEGQIRFRLNTASLITIAAASKQPTPFWLPKRDFKQGVKTNIVTKAGTFEYHLWTKRFEAGEVKLGVNAFTQVSSHYLIAVKAINPEASLSISDFYPGHIDVGVWQIGEDVVGDMDSDLVEVPEPLLNQMLVRPKNEARNSAKLLGKYRKTRHPSTTQADQIVLTWSADPKTTQTIQWRTATSIQRGVVAYQQKKRLNRFQPTTRLQKDADYLLIEDENLVNEPQCHRFTVTLTDLEPQTTYVYSVGNGDPDGWSELKEFTTAPNSVVPFSFVYMGDAQNGLDRWGTLVNNAYRSRPDAAFYIMAGDLVNRGNDRDDWDLFFYNAQNVYDRRQLVPAIGNHENQGGHPTLYLKNFTLPLNGADSLESERTYWFQYSNALFVILDTNQDPEKQTAWLDRVLSENEATWRFVVYHHPAYSSAPNRDNANIRKHWLPIFDKHHVDLALQGHDHAYLRTFPLKNNKRVKDPKNGTIYVVSVSGSKMYDQAPRDETEVGFTKIATYQTLDIQLAGDRLLYRAYDIDGRLRDELEIIKNDYSAWP